MYYAKDYRMAAWTKLSDNNWSTAVVAYLLYTLLMQVAGCFGIAALLFNGVLTVGMSVIMLQISRQGISKIEHVFDGFNNGFGNNVVAGLLVQLFVFLWSLLLIVPGIVKGYAYAMTYHILADDPDLAPTDAIRTSEEMMAGNKWRLFCLDCSFIGWYLLSLLTLGILGFWITPYHMLARTEFYESIKPRPVWQDDDFIGGMADGNAQL